MGFFDIFFLFISFKLKKSLFIYFNSSFSTAYKNITDSVSLARALAIESKLTIIESENELYPKEGESIIDKSTKSLKKSQKIHQNSLIEMEKMEGMVSIIFYIQRKFHFQFPKLISHNLFHILSN